MVYPVRQVRHSQEYFSAILQYGHKGKNRTDGIPDTFGKHRNVMNSDVELQYAWIMCLMLVLAPILKNDWKCVDSLIRQPDASNWWLVGKTTFFLNATKFDFPFGLISTLVMTVVALVIAVITITYCYNRNILLILALWLVRIIRSFWAKSIIRWGKNGRSPRKPTRPPTNSLAYLTCNPSWAGTHSGQMSVVVVLVFYGPSTLFMSFQARRLTYPHCSRASLLGSLPVLSAHSFVSNW